MLTTTFASAVALVCAQSLRPEKNGSISVDLLTSYP